MGKLPTMGSEGPTSIASCVGWQISPSELAGARRRWKARACPNFLQLRKFDEWVKRLEAEPTRVGTEDPDQPDIWYGPVFETGLIVTYVLDHGTRTVYVTSVD